MKLPTLRLGRRSESAPLAGADVLDEDELAALRSRWDDSHPDGGTRREVELARLDELRAGDGHAPAAPLDLRGLMLVDVDLSGLDLTGSDLSGADLSRAKLEGTSLLRAKLVGTVLYEANLARAELTGANLTNAMLERADLTEAGLGMATLDGARFFSAKLLRATLTEATARDADFRCASMRELRGRNVDFSGADCSRADARGADFASCTVDGACFDGTDLRDVDLNAVRGYQAASWIGVDIRDVDFTGAYLCRRFVLDQNFLDEFAKQGRAAHAVYLIWWATSDCGRSLLRWGVWTALIAVLFAGLYTTVGIDFGANETPISPLYFSVVTLTTLGYGDVLPTTMAGQLVAMVQVVFGYVMLGGLLSIFSNKMARRAE